MVRRFLAAVLLLSATLYAQVVPGGTAPGGTITGQIQTATSGAIKSGTLTFSLSQPAIVSNTASLATQQVACYTSAAGNIVGVPDPLALPIVSANLATGTTPAGTYYIQYFYTSLNGNSVASPELVFLLSSQGTLNINPPVLQPASATGIGVAISTTSGAEVIQGTTNGFVQFQQSQPLLSGSAAPTVNTSSCNIYFSDQLIPTGTYYTVNLTNKNASQVAGFPQTWCTYGGGGGVINVSQGAPTGNCNVNGVFYPTPLFASPINGALSQTVGSSLNLGSFSLTAAAINTNQFTTTAAGVFTDTQMNEYGKSIVGGLSTVTEFQTLQGPHAATEGLTGGVAAPSSSTVLGAFGVAGYATTASTSTNAVGVYGSGRSLATGAKAWGANFVVSDGGFVAPIIGNEIDVQNLIPGSTGAALTFNGTLQNANQVVAIQIPAAAATSPAQPWQSGISFLAVGGVTACKWCITFTTGATTSTQGSTAAIQFNPIASATNHVSQGIDFVANDPSSGQNTIDVYELAAGDLALYPSKAGHGLIVNGPVSFADGGNFGSAQVGGASACEANFGITTLSGASTNTSLSCLPANSIIDAVVYRVTTTITTATSFTIGDSGSATRYCGTQSTLTAGTTGVCLAAGYYLNTGALAVKITPSTSPGAGAIRLIVYYHTWTPPQS
jgi:hypothetical protein